MKKFYIIFIIVAIAAGAFWHANAQIMPPAPPAPPSGGFCGDKICNNTENNTSCPGDCSPGQGGAPGMNIGCKASAANNWTPGVPDGNCDSAFPPEDAFTCSSDCSGQIGGPPPATPTTHQPNDYGCLASANNNNKNVPDGNCDYQGGETYMNCKSDCGVGGDSPICNSNGVCEPYLGESWYMDGQECGDCVVEPVCNYNGVCEGSCDVGCSRVVTGKLALENPKNCPKDCGCPLDEGACNYDNVCDQAKEVNSGCADCKEPLIYQYKPTTLSPPQAISYGCDYDGSCESSYDQATGRRPENQFTCADCVFSKYSDGTCGNGEGFRKSYDCKKDPCNKDGVCDYYVGVDGYTGLSEDSGDTYRQETADNCFIDCKNLDVITAVGCSTPNDIGVSICGDSSHKATIAPGSFDSNCHNIPSFDVNGYTFNNRYFFKGINNLCYDKQQKICTGTYILDPYSGQNRCSGEEYYKTVDPSKCQDVDINGYGDSGGNAVCILRDKKWPWQRKPESGCDCNGVCEPAYGEKFSNCPSDCNTCGTDKAACEKDNQDKHFNSQVFSDFNDCSNKCDSNDKAAIEQCAKDSNCTLNQGQIISVNSCDSLSGDEKVKFEACKQEAQTKREACMISCQDSYFSSEEYKRFQDVSAICKTYGSGCDADAGEDASNCPQDCGTCGNKICDWAPKTATSTFSCFIEPINQSVARCTFDKTDYNCSLFPPVAPPMVAQVWNCSEWLKCDNELNNCTTTIGVDKVGYKCVIDKAQDPPKYNCLQKGIAICPVNNVNCSFISGEDQGNCNDCSCLENQICDKGETWEKCYDDCHCGDGKCKKNEYQTVSAEVIANPSLAGSVCKNGWYVHGVQDVRPTLDSIYKSQSSDWRYKYYWWVDDATGYEYYCLPDDSGQWGTECINAFNSSVNSKTGKQCCEPGPLCKVNYCDFDRVCDNLQFSTSSAGVKWGGTLGMDKFENPFTCPYDCPCYPSGSGSTWPNGGKACYSYVYPIWEENSKNCPNDCGNELGIITVTSTNVTAHTADLLVRISGLGGAPTGSYWVNYGIKGDTFINAPFPGVKSTNSFATITIPVQDLRGGQTYEFTAQLMVEEQYSPANFKVSGWTLRFTTPKGLCKYFSITAPGAVYPDEITEIKWGKSENCDDHYRILVLDSNGQAYMKFAGNGDTVKEILGSGLDEYKNNIEKNTFQWGADKKARPFEIVIVAYNKDETDYLEERTTVNVPEIPVLSSWWAAGSGKCSINGPSINFGFDFSSLLPDGGKGLTIDFKLYSTYELNSKVSEVNGVAGKQTGQINVGYYDDVGNPDPTDPSQPQPADQKYYLTSYLKWHGEQINVPPDSNGNYYKEVVLDDHRPPLVGFTPEIKSDPPPPVLDLHAFPYPPESSNSDITQIRWYFSKDDYDKKQSSCPICFAPIPRPSDPGYDAAWYLVGQEPELLKTGIWLEAFDGEYWCNTSTIPDNEFRSVNFREESGI